MALFDDRSTDERLALAKERTEKVVDHLRESILMHEANAIVVYSPTLTEQIPTSRAAHAFIQFQRSMHFFEIVRLTALWDKADENRESVPTILRLIKHQAVRKELKKGIRAQRAIRPKSDQKFGRERAAQEVALLDETIKRAKSVMDSEKLKSVRNLRDKSLAHSLTKTWLELRETVAPMKYGDERWLFDESIAVVDGLYKTINGAGFRWEHAREIAKRNASTLWNGCRFTIDERR